jgi:antibiotic biosynthesis monooxygenase (ABM) superfamily enzyme
LPWKLLKIKLFVWVSLKPFNSRFKSMQQVLRFLPLAVHRLIGTLHLPIALKREWLAARVGIRIAQQVA